MGDDRERWPERYRDAPRVFQATEAIGDDGAQALAALTGLTTLDLRPRSRSSCSAAIVAALNSWSAIVAAPNS